ncbi:uncharacterized protein LOC119356946 [Triticum dicoccoides]|uniref:uncharacterized protein LOC119356946 n=1 Tax=Triticum dicoccoides TaxID=85692 RepID=UPI00188F0373|nr:uncharacterized protein LOC119356946 [Triticum dicoccoides]
MLLCSLPRSAPPPATGKMPLLDPPHSLSPDMNPHIIPMNFSLNSLIPLCVCVLLACRSNPIGDVISLLQIEVVGVGRRLDAGWCRSELQCVSVEQIHHGCRGMEMLLRRRRELGLAIWKQSEECAMVKPSPGYSSSLSST